MRSLWKTEDNNAHIECWRRAVGISIHVRFVTETKDDRSADSLSKTRCAHVACYCISHKDAGEKLFRGRWVLEESCAVKVFCFERGRFWFVDVCDIYPEVSRCLFWWGVAVNGGWQAYLRLRARTHARTHARNRLFATSLVHTLQRDAGFIYCRIQDNGGGIIVLSVFKMIMIKYDNRMRCINK